MKLVVPLALATCLLFMSGQAGSGDEIASVLGARITREQLSGPQEEREPARRIVELMWRPIAEDFIARNGLRATAAELAEVEAYEVEFEKKDRAQRARKLAELDARLAANLMTTEERVRAEEFRDVLLRLARRDAELERQPKSDPHERATLLTPLIEMWKMNRSLYERYGGVVGLTELGPHPHGAWAALIADYEREGRLKFRDPALRERVFVLLAAPPQLVVLPGRVDFTPPWRKPIPTSYFPD